MNQSEWTLDTLLVHSSKLSRTTSNSGNPTVQPIYTSTTYLHSNAGALDQAFSGRLPTGEYNYVYARQGNPNAQTLEEILARAEDGVGALVFASSMAPTPASPPTPGLAPCTQIL